MKKYDVVKALKSILEQQIWLILTNKLDKLERGLANKLRAYFSKQQKHIISEFKKTKTFRYDDSHWKKELEKVFEDEIKKIIKVGIERAQSEHQHLSKSISDDIYSLYGDYVNEHVGEMINGINQTSREKLKQLIMSGLVDGKPVSEIAGDISELFNTFKSSRALTIARTETMGASNWTYLKQMERYGYTKKKYITAMDEYVCPVCRPLNGKIVAMSDNFSVALKTKGEKSTVFSASYPPMHPNCRCTVVTVFNDGRKVEKPKAGEQLVFDYLNEAKKTNWVDLHNEARNALFELKGDELFDACGDEDLIECYDKFENEVESTLKKNFNKISIYKLTHKETLEQIIKDGRLKNQFETSASSGFFHPEYRRDVENSYFNIPNSFNPEIEKYRPKYAVWSYDGYDDHLMEMAKNGSQYGNFLIKFKKSVNKKSTFTFADTLDSHTGENPLVPFAHDDYSIYSIPYYNIPKLMKEGVTPKTLLESAYPYTEAQMFGDIKLDDIDKVLIPSDYKGDKIIKLLEDAGVKYEFYN